MTSISLNYHPREWQRQCHAAMRRFTVLVLHRRAGKTELALMHLIDRAIRTNLDLPFYGYIAPFLKQAKQIAWARMKQRLRPLIESGAVDVRESELAVRFVHNGAVVRLYGADNADALRGLRLDGVVLDEVAQIAPETWHDIVQPALADRRGWAVFIGTVAGIDFFSDLYFQAADRPDWHRALYSVYDTDALPADEVERLRRDMSETAFAREFLCDFGASGDDQFISLDDALQATTRHVAEAELVGLPLVMGIDVARQGSDRTVVVLRRGLRVDVLHELRGADNMAVADLVAREIERRRPRAVFVDVGGGAGVVDRLRQLGHTIAEVNFGERALSRRQAANRRMEMWMEVRDWLRCGGTLPSRQIAMELATPTYSVRATDGRWVLEAKDEIKKRLHGTSPDLADAVALTFAAPVAMPDPYEAVRRGYRPAADYNPYEVAP